MTRRPPRWLAEAIAWAAALVLVAGIVGAWSIRGYDTRQVAYAETPAVESVRTITTPVPVPSMSYVPGKPAPAPPAARTRTRARALVPELGPPPGPQYDPPPARTAPPADRYAFLVGVTDYRAPTHDTIGAANDVRFIAALLEQRGWLPENIRVVTDGQATGSAVRSGLAWLAEKSTPGTFTLFHYSGHVKQSGSTEKLWPVDRSFVPDSEVASILSRGSGKLWVDIAGCEAGGFMGSLPSSRVLFSGSSTAAQKSYEYPEWGESVWAGLLFDIGTGQGAADANKNGVVTMGEALRYASYYAQAITRGQRPYGPQTPQVAGDEIRGWTLDAPPA
ncbi:MAG: caspase family protein [Actinobacteria bacterium]|nr:caspase family protein [Actinomycetota bacterium]MCA1720575.1 caspase family protein [Actinomycetota bacterium]